MEIFCSHTVMVKGFNIQFYPDKKKQLVNISFLYVPPKNTEELRTEFLNEYVPSFTLKEHAKVLNTAQGLEFTKHQTPPTNTQNDPQHVR